MVTRGFAMDNRILLLVGCVGWDSAPDSHL
jgi:hypothetical protein